jgi:transposase
MEVAATIDDARAERTPYGAGLIAYVVTVKCCDSLPLYRLEHQFARHGVPRGRSTLTDLFHRAGQELRPLADAVQARIATADVVLADETPLRMHRRREGARLWTFLGHGLVGYRFSESRSGDTPAAVLGGTTGVLVVDTYTALAAPKAGAAKGRRPRSSR